MPTYQQKANKLLKQGKAKVVKRKPFTIQLEYATGETKQDIVLGIDSGYSTVGFSAVTKQRELVSGELTLRKGISKLIEERKNYRRIRRNKLWYRQPRFNNRGRNEGWLAQASSTNSTAIKGLFNNSSKSYQSRRLLSKLQVSTSRKSRILKSKPNNINRANNLVSGMSESMYCIEIIISASIVVVRRKTRYCKCIISMAEKKVRLTDQRNY